MRKYFESTDHLFRWYGIPRRAILFRLRYINDDAGERRNQFRTGLLEHAGTRENVWQIYLHDKNLRCRLHHARDPASDRDHSPQHWILLSSGKRNEWNMRRRFFKI
jgi:hypothetical protein